MRKYEAFIIIDADLPDDGIASVDEKLKNLIAGNGGKVIDYVPWGKKKLAYAVKKRTRGHYVLMEFSGGSALVAELERNLRLDERILKFITVKLADRYDPEAEEAKAPKVAPAFTDEEEVLGVAMTGAEELAAGEAEEVLEEEEYGEPEAEAEEEKE
jgi:small subunit ribosomal protein S6